MSKPVKRFVFAMCDDDANFESLLHLTEDEITFEVLERDTKGMYRLGFLDGHTGESAEGFFLEKIEVV